MVSSPGNAFASWMAARSVHTPFASAQAPLPRAASGVSAKELTVNVTAAWVVGNCDAATTIKTDRRNVMAARTQARLVGGYKFIKILR
jgi:hypothetical protein